MRNIYFLPVFLFFQNIAFSQIEYFEPFGYDHLPINGGGGWAAVPIDLEGDGDLDLIALRSFQYDEIYVNDGAGHFSRKEEMAAWQIPGGTHCFAFADLNGDGRDDLVLGRGPGSGGCGGGWPDGRDQVLIHENDGTFTEASGNLPAGSPANCGFEFFGQNEGKYTMGMVTGDFNQDGLPDLVTANSGLIYQIQIRLMEPLGCPGTALACADYLNASLENGLYLGQPDGTVAGAPADGVLDFLDHSESSGIGSSPSLSTDVVTADFNGDGLDDIFVTNFHHFPISFLFPAWESKSQLWLNDPAAPGHFTLSSGFPSEDAPATSAAVSDFDQDGDIDLLVAFEGRAFKNIFNEQFGLGGQLFLNDGSGNFTEAPGGTLPDLTPSCVRSMYDAHLTDLNGDGWDDIYLAGIQSALFFQNPTDHTFTDMGHLLPRQPSGSRPYSFHTYGAAVADFTGDGRSDFFLVNTYEQNRLQVQMADNQFVDLTQSNLAPDGENNSAAAIADLDGDGDLDIVSAISEDCHHVQSVHEQTGQMGGHALFVDASDALPSANLGKDHTVATADLDGDGLPEILLAGEGAPRLLHNLGGMEFEDVTAAWFPGLANFQNVSQARFFDFDNDGDEDVFLANGRLSGLEFQPAPNALFLWNENTAQFEDSGWLPPNDQVTPAADFADLNGDGWPDILAVNEDASMEIYISGNDFPSADPGYSAVVPPAFLDNHSGHALFADFNLDGNMDIVEVTSCCPGGNMDMMPHYVYLNEGTFSGNIPDFSRHEIDHPDFQVYSLALSDINSDGHPDVVTGGRNDIRFYIWENSENRLIDRTSDYTDLNEISGLAMSVNDLKFADINSDGLLDLYMARDNQDILLYGQGETVSTREFFSEKNNMKIYPNPASGEVSIFLENIPGKDVFVEIYTMQGILVKKEKLNDGGESKILLSGFHEGMYLFRVKDEVRKIFLTRN